MEPSEREIREVKAVEAEAQAEAADCLPCPDCGSTATPVRRKPERESAEWWDDPSVYFACADCSRFLADLPVVAPFIWEPDPPAGS